jgi:hypothetical protein
MALLEKALDYIVGILTENEEVKKFPKDFVTASMQWIRSWFLIDDPKTTAKLADPTRSLDSKKTIIETKLEDLNENPQFVKELTEQLNGFEQQRARLKNVMTDADIDVKGSVHIGDKGASSGDNYDEKNVIKGGTIKAGGDFRLGDDVVSGNQNVKIVHNYFGTTTKGEKAPPQYQSLKSELKALVAQNKTPTVFNRLLNHIEQQDEGIYNNVLLLFGQFNRLNDKENSGLVSFGDANIERNRLNNALISVIDALEI